MDITEYYVLAKQIARKKYARLPQAATDSIELQDLEQEAYVGLIQAVQHFDPARGIAFHSYARPRITGAILDSLRRADILPQDKRRDVRELVASKEDVSKQLGREPDTEELSIITGKTTAEIREIERLSSIRIHSEHSLGQAESEDSLTLEERAAVLPRQEADLLGRDVDDCMDGSLTEIERSVIQFRFLGGLKLGAIGDLLGKPLQTIHNVSKRAQEKLKDCLEGKGWDVDEALRVL